ncbi:hypothetical protein K2173_027690 [Erythroxylum novogranatense]|uniref:Ser/Thr-rich protein T10 in DGCR region n=1 Tax=Erythroxylum novogranatense TaxID=1862640 RepID=A0AAV8U022_9ROSI|nr:hypothetical protein K2173_027690 [Erythroxylum novogranatense]
MCIAVFIWQAHPLYPLLLFQNRDEIHCRQVMPSEPVAWWNGRDILAGRDMVAGGTWMGCSRDGRIAVLTNVLELHNIPEARSRGELPVLFLESKKSPKEFAELLVKRAQEYNGFNLILADITSKKMVYFSNRPKGESIVVQEVSPGIHVLSNAKLDAPWHKAQRLKMNFEAMLNEYGESDLPIREMLKKLMRDTTKAERNVLPGICSTDWEHNLSSIFVEVDTPLGLYGTRSSVALSIRSNGRISYFETYLEDGSWKEKTVNYHISEAEAQIQ